MIVILVIGGVSAVAALTAFFVALGNAISEVHHQHRGR